MKTIVGVSLMILTLSLTNGCGRRDAGAVVWPELQAFDVAAERAEARLDAGHADEAVPLFEQIRQTAFALLESDVPGNVLNRPRVDSRLDDLRELVNELSAADTVDPQSLLAFHSIAEDLMDAAGMPHVHDHDH